MMKLLGKNLRFIILFLVVAFIAIDNSKGMQRLENMAFDLAVYIKGGVTDESIMVVAIDNKSLNHIGSWPWSRKRFAEVVDIISQGLPKLIVNTITFSETDSAPNTINVAETLRYLKSINIEEQLALALQPHPTLEDEVVNHFSKLRHIIMSGLETLNSDQQLASAYERAGNVLQAMEFIEGGYSITQSAPVFPEYLKDSEGLEVLHLPSSIDQKNKKTTIKLPVPGLGKSALAVGAFMQNADFDGVVRKSRLVVESSGVQIPTLALSVVAKSQKIPLSKVAYSKGELNIGTLSLGVSDDLQFYHKFYANQSGKLGFETVSFADLLNGHIKPEIFYNKIVLIGGTSHTVSPGINTSVSNLTAPVELLAHQVTTMLNQSSLRVVGYSSYIKIALYIAIGGFLLLVLPTMPKIIAILTVFVIPELMITVYYKMLVQGLWLPIMGPFLLFLVGAAITIIKGEMSGLAQLSKTKQDQEEAQRMLGLAFQGQGQLDLAFSKFVSCRLDPMMMEILYDLASDYERSRRFEQAIEVLQYISVAKPDYRDIQERLEHNQIMLSQGIELDEDRSPGQPPLIFIDKYSLGEELGRGPIGTVFLGRDSRANRLVAIKLIPMVEIFEASMMEEALSHFVEIIKIYEELDHPNIVKVFNGGDSYGRAFLVMEYIAGRNLSYFVHKKRLLSMPRVIQIVVKLAMVLDFAQQKGAVHGNLKPSNVLFDPDSREIKVVDFALSSLIEMGGTRLITMRPQAQAQAVAYYLAPECAAGQSPDYRSDIFSLGVLFYRLLTGEVPFLENKQQHYDPDYDLIYDNPKPASQHNSAVPSCIEKVLAKALNIDPQQRYQRGAHLARALVNCVKSQVSVTNNK
ncbi:MAG: CHASE2 domain-containing protein [Magnetococcales bacterium]|nr:CHASE2 domain-containing protein [Magnetococcales bacterium]